MSTADCKALLVARYPDTQAKEWKRQAKFNNVMECEIRRFAHPTVGTVWVNEDYREVVTNERDFYIRQPKTFVASDFYFSIQPYDEGDFGSASAIVSLVYKDYFDEHGYMDSVHLEHTVKAFYPKGLRCREDMEAVFAIEEDLTLDAIRESFLQAGFLTSPAFEALIQESME
ncbi:hypothetical protein RBE51_19755 [Pseudomonas taiwanensis]|uniref:hypothetical protein n=1 Tax=Pseudomonas taiwanensis TaxID=470150 RepID=UPI0028DF1E31|nr:hypothetical protein [Pseudomonas taiwanensis]MDT8925028.1 hypothetical protein [Pseudomonas taiwanensis]